MKTTRIAIAALIAAGLASSPFAAMAKSNKQSKSHSSMTTTGSNTKTSHSGSMGNMPAANPSGQGNVGPGTNNNMGPAPGGK